MDFQSIADAYCVVEMYDFDSVDRAMYREAVDYVYNKIKKDFGKDDYRVREMFSLIQEDEGWETTFKVRYLIHAIMIKCPHEKQEDCDKGMTTIESYAEDECRKKYPDWKPRKCSHCSHLESLKAKWEKK